MRYTKFKHQTTSGGDYMAGYGFIHDKLDIKFLILYIAARVIEPIPFVGADP